MKAHIEIGLNGKKHQSALTLVEVLVVIAVIGVLIVMLMPALSDRPVGAPRIKCAYNLKQIGIAFKVWEGDNGDHYPMSVLTNRLGNARYENSDSLFRYFQVMSNELANPNLVWCPSDLKHRAPTNFTSDFDSTRISYFVALNADENLPQGFLAGDANLTNGFPFKNGLMRLATNSIVGWTEERHINAGNILMADGSVQQLTTSGLQTALKHSGTNQVLLLPP